MIDVVISTLIGLGLFGSLGALWGYSRCEEKWVRELTKRGLVEPAKPPEPWRWKEPAP